MLIGEVDRLLDRQCTVSFTNDYQIFEISRKFGIKASSIVLLNSDNIEVFFYIQKGAERFREVKILLDAMNAREIYGNWVFSSKSDRYEELSIVSELIQVPSVSIDGIYLNEGYLSVNFRFHSHFNELVSPIVSSYVSKFQNFQIKRMGPSPGLINILKSAVDYTPLSLITTLNTHEGGPAEDNPLGTNWIRELKYISTDGQIHAIYKTDIEPESLGGKVTVISQKDGIYEATTKNSFVDFYSTKTNSDMISSLSRIQSASANKLVSSSIFPRSYLGNYLRIISEAKKKFADWKISLLEVRDFP
ncbi:MAG: hypothetical protein B2I17_04415 [Thermoplasmatales archaeon B_DKE]|nr:MAG: hypothetical protein B2I17_04415 [Thermoplasmatales archaeon B_DKE]